MLTTLSAFVAFLNQNKSDQAFAEAVAISPGGPNNSLQRLNSCPRQRVRCLSLPSQVQGYTQLRATGSSVGSVLHKKATGTVLVAAAQSVKSEA